MELDQQLPTLASLAHSHSPNDMEDELRLLTLDLYGELLAETDYDINLLGMPHLATLPLVQREIAADGLFLMRDDTPEYLTRCLYRAWRGRNRNGRGLYFLRLYLRLLFGDAATATQIKKSATTDHENSIRPDWYRPRFDDPDLRWDGSWQLDGLAPWREPDFIFDEDDVYPSNRIRVTIDYQAVDPKSVRGLTDILRRILPVRFVPVVNLESKSAVTALTGVY